MANYPQGWQYPMYPQGPVAPGSMVQPRPPAMQRAVSLMYAGAALAVINGIVEGLTTHLVTFYSYSSTSPNTATVHYGSSVVTGIISGIITGGLWLWMAWKTGAGRNWARVLSTIFFAFGCLQLIGSISALAGSGHPVLAFIVMLVEWGVGLAALIYLWRRESNGFFALAKQAKLAGTYGAAYPGYPPPGYGLPPQYGQPQSGSSDQPSPDDRPQNG